ncbi:MAG: alpha/beta hydrolase [Candidatus Latescibacteria bacterium]|nr:alpha/beta hydrolase [Candidatus Latescibacterota bacterium]
MRGIEILLQHGWGWDAGCWAGWRDVVPSEVRLLEADRGYFGAPSSPVGQPQVLVAHSFGLHLLEPRWLATAELVVVFGGFQAFHPEGEAGRRSRRLVGRMHQRLDRESDALLADFRARCFSPETGQYSPPGEVEQQVLAMDLECLDTQALDLRPLIAVPRVLLLHGDQDQIVPVAQARQLHQCLPNSRLEIIPGAGHALPLTRAPACWAQIRRVWEGLSA